jgi:Tfp pilus assembly protein PilO
VKNKKPMPKFVPFVVAALVPVLLGAAGYIALVKPKAAEAKRIDAQTAQIQAQIADYQSQAASRNTAPKIKYTDVYRLQQALPTTIRVPDLILELDRVAADAGISFDSISFPAAPPPSGASYNPFPVSLSFSGNFYTVTDLMYRLRSLVSVRQGRLDATGPLISIDSVGLTPSGKKLAVTLSITAYTYAPAAPTTAVTVGGAPPTSTDTTSTSTDTTSTATTPSSSASASGAP